MHSTFRHYDILDISPSAGIDDIKQAYRRAAMRWHPDRNNNADASQTQFIIIQNAYDILSDSRRRAAYDQFIAASRNFQRVSRHTAPEKKQLPGTASLSAEELYRRINILLWDIEDFIRIARNRKTYIPFDAQYSSRPLWQYILTMLTFIDRWMLDTAILTNLCIPPQSTGWVPIANYFFALRKRADRMFSAMTDADLLEYSPFSNERKIDCIIESERHTMHYLNFLIRIQNDASVQFGAFECSKPFYRIPVPGLDT